MPRLIPAHRTFAHKAVRDLRRGASRQSKQALVWGLVDEVAADGEALASALRWAEASRQASPMRFRVSKQSVNAAANALHQATTFMDLDQYVAATTSEDYREAIKAFLENEPRFGGR